ncbi:MAG: hypothetical protein AB1758_34655, partial [Candidatus Eremiobacterota bacterium]
MVDAISNQTVVHPQGQIFVAQGTNASVNPSMVALAQPMLLPAAARLFGCCDGLFGQYCDLTGRPPGDLPEGGADDLIRAWGSPGQDEIDQHGRARNDNLWAAAGPGSD